MSVTAKFVHKTLSKCHSSISDNWKLENRKFKTVFIKTKKFSQEKNKSPFLFYFFCCSIGSNSQIFNNFGIEPSDIKNLIMSHQSTMNFSEVLKNSNQRPAITTITIPPTIINNESSTNASSSVTTTTNTTNISSNSSFPLPRVNHPSFRAKWENRFLSYSCGITLDPVHGAKQIEYLEEIDKIVEAKNIVSIGKNTDGRYVVFFTSDIHAEKIIQNGLVVANISVTALPVTIRPTRVLVSNLTPNIPDSAILDFLKGFGRVTSPLRPVPINSNDQEKFAHILSARREVYVQIEKGAVIPQKIRIVHENNPTYVTFETDVKCFKCKKSGHLASNCEADFPSLSKVTQNIADRLIVCTNCNLNGHFADACSGTVKKPERMILRNVQDVFSKENITETRNIVTEAQQKSSPSAKRQRTTTTTTTTENSQSSSIPIHPNSFEMQQDDNQSVTSEMSIDLETINIDEDVEMALKSSLPIGTLQQLLEDLNYKKSPAVIKKIVDLHTTDYKSLPNDFRAYKEHIKMTTPNATFAVQRIDRLIPKLLELAKFK